MRNDGYLDAAAGSPYPGQGQGAFGSQFSPINPDQLFVSNPHNGTDLGTVSAFNDGSGGTLSPIGASPYADGQTAPCWVAITPDGRYLFAVNAGSEDISRYAIAQDGTLTLLGTTTVSGNNPGPLDAEVEPRRTDAVHQRERHPRRRSVRGAGRKPDRATKLTGRPAGRRHRSRSFLSHLAAGANRPHIESQSGVRTRDVAAVVAKRAVAERSSDSRHAALFVGARAGQRRLFAMQPSN